MRCKTDTYPARPTDILTVVTVWYVTLLLQCRIIGGGQTESIVQILFLIKKIRTLSTRLSTHAFPRHQRFVSGYFLGYEDYDFTILRFYFIL